MPKKWQFPKTLYIRREVDGDTVYFVSFTDELEAIEGDGPTDVASYTIVSTRRVRKVLQDY